MKKLRIRRLTRLAPHMMDNPYQANNYLPAIISELDNKIFVQWDNGNSCKVDHWSDIEYLEDNSFEEELISSFMPLLNLLRQAFNDGALTMYDISRNRTSFTFDGDIEFKIWCKKNDITNQIKDNPVPSIDKTYEIYFAEGSYGFAHEKSLPKESPIFDTFLEKIGEFTCNEETLKFILKSINITAKWFNDLQNGVETDKEQPKFRCELEKPDFNKRIVIYKNDKVVSTSDWNHPEGSMFHIYNGMEFTQHGYNGEIYWRFVTEESKNSELKTCRELLAQGKSCGNCVNYCTMSGVCIN